MNTPAKLILAYMFKLASEIAVHSLGTSLSTPPLCNVRDRQIPLMAKDKRQRPVTFKLHPEEWTEHYKTYKEFWPALILAYKKKETGVRFKKYRYIFENLTEYQDNFLAPFDVFSLSLAMDRWN
jgi:hypothetical protein